jgi:hypothetical protein
MKPMGRRLFFIFICMIPVLAFGQGRHLTGIPGLALPGGLTGQGAFGSLGVSRNLAANLYGKLAADYEQGTVTGVNYSSYMLDAAIGYTLIQIKDDVFFNAYLGASGLYDDIEELDSTIDQSGFSAGILGGAEIEIYISDTIVLLLNGTQRYYFGSDFGNSRWMLGIGMKFTF